MPPLIDKTNPLFELVQFYKTHERIVFSCVIFLGSWLVIWPFHNQFLWPPDEGAYAYVADLINRGFVLNRDVQDVHLGYVNFTNALSLRVFGDSFSSMRYPLVFMTAMQSSLIAYLFYPNGRLLSVVSALVLSSLSFIQFVNPTANWYALFLVCLTIFYLHKSPMDGVKTFVLAGFLLGLLFCYRQLSGVWAAIGVVSYLLRQNESTDNLFGKETWLARFILSIFLFVILWYLVKKTDYWGVILYGIWPVLLLVAQIYKCNTCNRASMSLVRYMMLGGLLSIVPLIIYHAWHGSIAVWFSDVFLSAIKLTDMEFFNRRMYGNMLVFSFMQVFSMDLSASLNGLFWFVLSVSPAILGVSAAACVVKDKKIPALGYVAAFYMLVSAHYQIPIYIFYSTPLVLVGVLWLARGYGSVRRLWCCLMVIISFVGLYYQAAQPLSRGVGGIMTGVRSDTNTLCKVEFCDVYIEPEMADLYKNIVLVVESYTSESDAVLSIPFNPEINYLTKRVSPLRYYNLALGIHDELSLERAVESIGSMKTKLVFYDSYDKYNTRLVGGVMEHVRQQYSFLGYLGKLEVYVLE